MIEIEHSLSGDCITIRASGRLSIADYDRALPEVENALVLAKGPLKMLVRLEDFHGLEIGALWEDAKFGLKHSSEFGSIAVVGETKLAEWGAWLSSFFVSHEIRYFGFDEVADAQNWLDQI